MSPRSFSVNGRDYAASPEPVVIICCIDGSEPDYHVEAMRAGRMP
jgi:phosphonoacetate hydrolase